ncbi:MAG: 50S ribosomal protein P1 [Candidatus Aenigmarchaeota archaeon]|nr:50S ribosomal protein P1 [Candidatus Aenigmarchaeota archaeon]
MNYVYASLLLHSAGKPINEENVKKVVAAAGDQPDEAKIKALISALDGVNIEEVISKAAMPVAVAAPVATGAAAATEKKEEGPSEAEMEKKAEEAASGLASLFG